MVRSVLPLPVLNWIKSRHGAAESATYNFRRENNGSYPYTFTCIPLAWGVHVFVIPPMGQTPEWIVPEDSDYWPNMDEAQSACVKYLKIAGVFEDVQSKG